LPQRWRSLPRGPAAVLRRFGYYPGSKWKASSRDIAFALIAEHLFEAPDLVVKHGSRQTGKLSYHFLCHDGEEIREIRLSLEQCELEPAQHAQIFGDSLGFAALRTSAPHDSSPELPSYDARYTQRRPLTLGELIYAGQDEAMEAGGQV
jgi:hypothetical protein